MVLNILELEELITERFSVKRLERTTTFHDKDLAEIKTSIEEILSYKDPKRQSKLMDIICRAKNTDTFKYLVNTCNDKNAEFAKSVIEKYVGINDNSPVTLDADIPKSQETLPSGPQNEANPDIYKARLQQIKYQKKDPNFRERRMFACIELAEKISKKLGGVIH